MHAMGEKDRTPVIVSAVRTPFGSLQGSLSSLSATQLGSFAIQGALERISLEPGQVQEVFMGNVLSAGLGQAPARQAALGAVLPQSVICTTVNKVCASGMKAVMLAAQSIQTGANEVVVAGGMESMSNVPYYLKGARSGLRMGHGQLTDGMISDGLWDPYSDVHMGECAEACAAKYGISREEQDAHALASHDRATAARERGYTKSEVIHIEVVGKRGRPSTMVTEDEAPGKLDAARLRQLRPAFPLPSGEGTVTAGNASPITDGAAALVLMSAAKAAAMGLKVLGTVLGYADAAQAPQEFTTAPAQAIPKAISAARVAPSQVYCYEINEAFSVVDLVNRRLLQLDPERVNMHGGSVALGHPIGASGAAIIVRLLTVLGANNGSVGVAAICNGGGGASALVLRRS
ncbi:acetyl-CoA acetyltransferase [Coccomyxa subellipsoidea C-169]|uniref:acetyl-CoA C-acetyltransferase n=1 Tax=Coccomyxa subellipsoidea (strain C-169) TaxID=574566 RepID=I0YTW8_COCSC|nr:acetyl-CoA acetyltransferase [Coccomyxa subellipsoidea C-169]EIE21837.1 acetyl-CoA acetyltransferase [Coccomyxa subellipsoidea C-169]|eukprot:XP_005646381.1 acetyl-CoA acetyltransferase [Coccomyxa subellipsoidea C-169]